MRRRYTPEQIAFIREIAPGRYNEEIAELFNARFGANATACQIRSLKKNYNIKSGVPRRRITSDEGLFTKEQKEFLIQNVGGRHNRELVDLVNEKFGLSVTVKQIKAWKKNHGYSSGLRGSEGMAPPNKGKPRTWAGGEATRFRKGHLPHNYMPVGSERVNADGYIDVKIADPNKWRGKHLLVWEQHHGRPVPKGYAVIFGDGNRRNFDPENLILVSRQQLAVMNKHGLIRNNTELTKTGIIMADLLQKIAARKKSNKPGKRRNPNAQQIGTNAAK
jgi:hypothetical protein